MLNPPRLAAKCELPKLHVHLELISNLTGRPGWRSPGVAAWVSGANAPIGAPGTAVVQSRRTTFSERGEKGCRFTNIAVKIAGGGSACFTRALRWPRRRRTRPAARNVAEST